MFSNLKISVVYDRLCVHASLKSNKTKAEAINFHFMLFEFRTSRIEIASSTKDKCSESHKVNLSSILTKKNANHTQAFTQ